MVSGLPPHVIPAKAGIYLFGKYGFPLSGLLKKPGNSKNDLNLLPRCREKVAPPKAGTDEGVTP
ncbi:MAG: hypothetical protein CO189_11095 [candidate division Zixibacteria bacterium CG_4_9_14_3_um_filter_46_8]|nr:MAG: hypothetical protein CO189_11095 [candidate division Zixibacteria bacterium CG_4_9_14_3_um_filter_46_8]